jgi:addiction module RelE/StbE family toxin
MMPVEWTRSAVADLVSIYEYIAKDSERYAISVVDRLSRRTLQIGRFPYSGEFVPEYRNDQIREVVEYSYRIIYLVKKDTIYVLAVVHGARLLPEKMPLPEGGN